MNLKNKLKAFTLLELSVVVIILAILSLVAIPNMLKTVNRGYAKDTMNNLMAIYAAQQDYKENHGAYLAPCDLACINRSLDAGGLGLNIVASGGSSNYRCEVASIAVCWVTNGSFPSSGFQGYITLNKGLNSMSPSYCNVMDPVNSPLNPCCFNHASNPKVPGSQCP